jgi:hypothetical protein
MYNFISQRKFTENAYKLYCNDEIAYLLQQY